MGSYIAKPWSDLAKPARQLYLQQNFNFTCLCKACTLPPEEEEALRKQLSAQNNGKKPEGKLATMLMRWMQDGHDSAPADVDTSHLRDSTSEPKKEEKRPLTDEER